MYLLTIRDVPGDPPTSVPSRSPKHAAMISIAGWPFRRAGELADPTNWKPRKPP